MIEVPAFTPTRLQPPRRPAGWVDRPRLLQRLQAAVQAGPFTLLCAAAGYGKTAVLTQLAAQQPAGTALAWVDADHDEQLPGFLACLGAALGPLAPHWPVAPQALATLALADGGLQQVAQLLASTLGQAAAPAGLIVVDDGHRIGDDRVFQLLQALVEALPPRWHLLYAARTEPPLPLARWQGQGRLQAFRQADLQFQADEVHTLVQATRPSPLQAEEAAALWQRTQGWAAGLRLCLSVAAPTRQAAERLSQRHLFDFLATEVLADMPPRLREFLLQCAVLPELSAGRCARLTGAADAAALLEEVQRRGLFVTALAAEQPTLQLHDLFREFLEDRLRREQPEAWRQLLQRAAADEPDPVRAASWLLRAGAWDAALGVLLQRGLGLLATGGASTLLQLLAQFPPEQAASRPDVWMLRGLCAWPGYDFDSLRRCMHEAVAGYAAAGRERDAALASAHLCAGLQHMGRFDEGTRILASLQRLALDDAAMAFIHYGLACDAVVCGRAAEVAPALAAMRAALQRVPDAGVWQQCPLQVMMVGAPGSAAQIAAHAQAVLQVAGQVPNPLRAGARHALAWQAVLAGRFDDAATQLALADDDFHWLGQPRMVHTDNRLLHGLLHAVRGDAAAARAAGEALIEDTRRAASVSFRRVHEPAMLFNQARVAWLLQDTGLLREMAQAMHAARHAAEWPAGRGAHGLVAAMLALAENRLPAALEAFEALDERLDAYFLCAGTQARGLHAWALLRAGRLDEAAARLRPVLDAPADEEPGALVLVGAPVLRALAEADWQGRLAASGLQRLAGLLARARQARGEVGAPAAAPNPSPIATPSGAPPATPPEALDPLTPREAQILALLAAGQSNKQLALTLGLSVHTVKQHVASVLGKLGVANRGQAAAWWHARGK